MFLLKISGTGSLSSMNSTPSYKGCKYWLPGRIAATALIILHTVSVQAGAKNCDNPVAHLVSVEGVIESRSAEGGWHPLALNAPVCTDDIIRTGPNSRGAVLVVGSDTMLRLDQTTTFQIVTQMQEKETTLIDLFSGIVHFISRVRHRLQVRTPYVNAAIEGTEFTVMVGPEESSIVLVEGRVLASNDAGSLRMEGEQTATAKKGRAPQFTHRITPEDAVQWTLHYQPILHGLIDPAEVAAQDPLESTFSAALAALRRNDTASAFASLRHIPPTGRTPRFHNYRAALFLLVGRVEEAQRELERSLQLRADNNGAALALQAMIAVAQNKKAEALALANRAVAADQNSAAPLIALSYAQQAQFDLHGALDSINRAVLREPNNPYAHARLSELRLSHGDLDGADIAAQRAVALDPEIELTQTVLGFARLIQLDLEQAKVNFSKAIMLSSSSPMPHLGMALTLIRQGNLEAGRRELEIATALDPGNALVRSYMGKAYYEERRDELAATQYSLAKERDPKDPTPWYYHALLLQQQGQTVEALHNLQVSAELNDNRAVYRSQLLLDQDQAARNAGLGQIYRGLNFEQLALTAGWKSLNADPADHSGHRLLADTYTHLPRHEVARVSELLQAQLLQPANGIPIRPIMTEAALHVPDGMGLSDPSFNEYSSLFNRDGLRAQVSAVLGNEGQAGEEVLLSGMKSNISFSLGQYHYETDGWRDNNDQNQDIFLGFVQANLSPDTSVQLEVRNSRKDFGDLLMYFYESQYSTSKRRQEKLDVVRLGLHHRFNPGSQLIASVIRGKNDDHTEESPGIADIESVADRDDWSAEVRQLLDYGAFRLTGGVGYSKTDVKGNAALTLEPLPGFFIIPPGYPIDRDYTDHQRNAYLYSWIDLAETLTLNLGLSYDDYGSTEFGGYERHRVNPKLGLTWRPWPNTTIRAAAFRTLYRDLLTKQTIEPTEVAGFNQFFDAAAGERVRHRGIALDHRFSSNLSAGVEFTHLERITPVRDLAARSWNESKKGEELGRANLYWTPNRRMAVGVEYEYERSHIDDGWIDTTHRFPLSLSYFHPSGIGGSLRPTYVRQYGEFLGGAGNDSQDFWNLDLSLDFRFPNRQGRISFEVRNLLDEEFGYEDKDPNLPLFVGKRMAFMRISLSF